MLTQWLELVFRKFRFFEATTPSRSPKGERARRVSFAKARVVFPPNKCGALSGNGYKRVTIKSHGHFTRFKYRESLSLASPFWTSCGWGRNFAKQDTKTPKPTSLRELLSRADSDWVQTDLHDVFTTVTTICGCLPSLERLYDTAAYDLRWLAHCYSVTSQDGKHPVSRPRFWIPVARYNLKLRRSGLSSLGSSFAWPGRDTAMGSKSLWDWKV